MHQITALLVFITVCSAGCTASEIDACLDQGGSYDYENCQCDYHHNHAYKEEHDC